MCFSYYTINTVPEYIAITRLIPHKFCSTRIIIQLSKYSIFPSSLQPQKQHNTPHHPSVHSIHTTITLCPLLYYKPSFTHPRLYLYDHQAIVYFTPISIRTITKLGPAHLILHHYQATPLLLPRPHRHPHSNHSQAKPSFSPIFTHIIIEQH